jgi:hypothetical protein
MVLPQGVAVLCHVLVVFLTGLVVLAKGVLVLLGGLLVLVKGIVLDYLGVIPQGVAGLSFCCVYGQFLPQDRVCIVSLGLGRLYRV